MARLPQPGGDEGSWGEVLNDYLSMIHAPDGSLKPGIISEDALNGDVVAKLNIVAGQQGPTGPQGPQGTTGTQGATGATGVGSVGATGPQGIQGTQGPSGVAGATGATGPQGDPGADGTSVTILGSYATENDLTTAHPTGNIGDAYMVDGDLYVWTGSAWDNVGPIRGPEGATGPQGPAGTQGATGPQGATGAAGQDGQDGQDGEDGISDQLISFSQEGTLTTGTGQGRFVFPMAVTIEGVMTTVGTAPSGSAVVVDINRNGTTIFSTQANRPSIAAGSTVSTQATPNTTSLSAGQYLTVDIDQVGSATAGSDLTVVIRYRAV